MLTHSALHVFLPLAVLSGSADRQICLIQFFVSIQVVFPVTEWPLPQK